MRDQLLRHVRAIAVLGLMLVAYSVVMTLISCSTGSTGTIGAAQYLDLVCPLDQPRALSRGDPLAIGVNRIALPGIIGALLVLTSGGLALLFSILYPPPPASRDAPKFDWPGRGNRQRIGEGSSHGADR